MIHSIDRQRYYESFRGTPAAFRAMLMDAMENSLDNGLKYFRDLRASTRRSTEPGSVKLGAHESHVYVASRLFTYCCSRARWPGPLAGARAAATEGPPLLRSQRGRD